MQNLASWLRKVVHVESRQGHEAWMKSGRALRKLMAVPLPGFHPGYELRENPPE